MPQQLTIDDIKDKYTLSPAKSRGTKRGLEHDAPPQIDSKKMRNATSIINTDLAALYKRIDATQKTAYQKKVLKILSQVPTGSYSTYGAMSKALNSSPRAVGNALRENPLAPDVPCHRILSSTGELGGFKGSWGVEGLYAKDKLKLLREEGVLFDPKGKVLGLKPFTEFNTSLL